LIEHFYANTSANVRICSFEKSFPFGTQLASFVVLVAAQE
jgi:hypothetical protein